MFELKNTTTATKNVFLYLSQPFLDYLTFYIVENGVVVKEAEFRYEEKLKKGLIKHLARPSLEIETKPGVATQVFMKFRNTAGILIIGMELLGEESFFSETTFEQNFYTILLGIILSFSVLAIAFYFISKSRIYLYYGLYVFFIAIAIQGTVGNLYNMSSFKLDFFNGDSSFRFYATLGIVFNVFFLEKFFELPNGKNFNRQFNKVILGLCYFVLLITVLDWGFIYYPISSFVNPYTLFILLCLIAIIYNFKRKPQTVKLYLLSFSPVFIVLIIRILSEQNFIETPMNFSHFAYPSLALEYLILLIGLAIVFIKDIKEKLVLEAKLISNQIETQERERKIIAEDLHDDLGATLSALKGSIVKAAISDESQGLLNKAITDLRAISRRLLPADFETYGFIPSLEKYIEELNQQQKLKITLIVFGEIVPLNTEKELNIYRIITELVNNSMKHSNGQNATVQLIYHDDYLFISVEDDGVASQAVRKGSLGIGLKNVIARLAYLNAKPLITDKENGYAFITEIPYLPNK